MPVYLYDHSGLALSTTQTYPFDCKWDAGQVGIIYVLLSKAKEECPKGNDIIEWAKNLLIEEIKTLNQYLSGDVWGFVIYKDVECPECGHVEEEVIESVWNYYGYKYCLECAQEAAKNLYGKKLEVVENE